MASAWIVSIVNNSKEEFIFQQTDPNMHPVIEDSSGGVEIVEQHIQNPQRVQVQSGQHIRVPAGARLKSSWFAIPWQGWGNLEISHGDKRQNIVTGPQGGKDYMIFDGAVNTNILIGNQNAWQNVEFEVTIDSEKGLVFKPIGNNDFDWLRQALIDIAVKLFKAIISGNK
jgi:hypothetical protein